MAENRKSIIEKALLEAEQIDKTFKANAKEILAQTMGSEIEEMVKESLEGSLAEEDDDDLEMNMDMSDDMSDVEMTTDDEMDMGDEIEFELDDLSDEDDNEVELDLDFDMETEMDDEIETVDLTDESDETVISVFKKMSPEDEIEVVQDGNEVTVKDNGTGAEYVIQIGDFEESEIEMDDMEMVSQIDMDDESMEESEIVYEIEMDEEENMEEDESMEEASRTLGSGRRFGRAGLNKPKAAPRHLRNEGVEEREVTSDNVNRYVQGTKISAKQLKAAMDRGDEVKMFSNKEKQTGEGGRHKKVFKVGSRYYSETDSLIDGGKAEAMAYLNESRSPRHLAQESRFFDKKLISENKVLKNKTEQLVVENENLKSDYNKLVSALKEYRNKLNDVVVFNSNLTHAVRLFTENTTTKEEKLEIIKRFDEAKTTKESESIYKQIVKEVSGKKSIKESVEDTINTTKTSGTSVEINESKVFVHPELEKMKKLWDFNHKY